MTALTPPISLDGLPKTQSVWDSLLAFQESLRVLAKASRITKVKSRLEYTLWPDTPNAGNGVYEAVERKISMHQRLALHDGLTPFNDTRLTLAMALQNHPVNFSGKHVFRLRAHASAKILSGSHQTAGSIVDWNAGNNPAILEAFVTLLAQHERLSQVTPKGQDKHYALVHVNGPSTGFAYSWAVDAADAALKNLIGNRHPLYQGADFYRDKPDRPLPEPGTCPEGEEDWLDVLRERAEAAGIPLQDRK
jgi:hypothetical protein